MYYYCYLMILVDMGMICDAHNNYLTTKLANHLYMLVSLSSHVSLCTLRTVCNSA